MCENIPIANGRVAPGNIKQTIADKTIKHKKECIKVLISGGYPKEDIGLLLAINPSILLYEPDDLQSKLDALCGDIEEIIKTDPFII